uniref:Putative secreted protein n=1 Tax=Anopheles marajoara TaxID=58244 RepID=A0A2M4CBW6_9DIPT
MVFPPFFTLTLMPTFQLRLSNESNGVDPSFEVRMRTVNVAKIVQRSGSQPLRNCEGRTVPLIIQFPVAIGKRGGKNIL